MPNARMRFSGFEPRGRLKQQIRFQTTFLSTRGKRVQSNTQAHVQSEIDALRGIDVNSGRTIRELSKKPTLNYSSILINNQAVELTKSHVLSNGKILPVGTIAKLDKKGVVATFPDGKTVTYAGVTEQKALPKPNSSAHEINKLKSADEINFADGMGKFTDSMDDKAFSRLVKSVKENGFTNSVVEYVEINEKAYIVRGNNRVFAAEYLGRIHELKFKKVDFPVPNTSWKNPTDVLNESGNVKRPRYRSK